MKENKQKASNSSNYALILPCCSSHSFGIAQSQCKANTKSFFLCKVPNDVGNLSVRCLTLHSAVQYSSRLFIWGKTNCHGIRSCFIRLPLYQPQETDMPLLCELLCPPHTSSSQQVKSSHTFSVMFYPVGKRLPWRWGRGGVRNVKRDKKK